ncbi:hypothetical protein ACIGCM_03740 [Pseudomonas sp. NPDC078700]|uniref:hypothetical protein n=1 Tax=Pseudomonas sp. NPDC078700 TaxID=3364424 RepID=UPI0037C69848
MKELTLYLDDLSPGQLSMKRLAGYLRALSAFYGSEEAVHFDRVDTGSAQLMSNIEDKAYPIVMNQVREVSGGLGKKSAVAAYKTLSEYMAADGTGGSIRSGGATIFQFPKVKIESPPLRIVKPSSVQGRLYSVGGKDDTIPVRLEGADNESLLCEADIAVAERLGQLLFKQVRLHGDGEWVRSSDGAWKLVKLRISSFSKLEDIGFKEAIARLKAAGGVDWNDIPTAHSNILETRG